MRYNSNICDLCDEIVGIKDGVVVMLIPVAETQFNWVESECSQCKNGYCLAFRKQAELDKIQFGVHDRIDIKNNSK